MKLFLLIFIVVMLPVQLSAQWSIASPMPKALANNAVASLDIVGTTFVYSFMGIDSTKIWSGVTRQAFAYNNTTNMWSEIASVPGTEGRIAAAAVGFKGKIYLFGGYSLAPNGNEITYPNVDIYDPSTDNWSSGAPAPVAVDDQVIAVWRDSLIYSVSGWSSSQNVKNVQIYNPLSDDWMQATEIPGAGVFGHTGGIVGDTLVYFDGARNSFNFPLNGGNFMGIINPLQPDSITWSSLPAHPGPRKYRAASATLGARIFFVGGSDNSYNFNGIGYNGQPSEPSNLVFAFNSATGGWESFGTSFDATMDHRAMGVGDDSRLFLVGGMIGGQVVSNKMYTYLPEEPISSVSPSLTSDIAEEFLLQGNFPNPFNPSTTIRYSLPLAEHVTLELFTVSGERVRTLLSETQPVGVQSFQFYASELSSGVYIYRLTTESGSQAKKMIFLK
ncbi:MAG: T9SS type A sorting domain-containing protein [Calditrichia bacterium]